MTGASSALERAKRRVADRLQGVVHRQVGEAIASTRDSVAQLQGELRALNDRIEWLENEIHRLGPHVAAQGERIGVLEQGYRPIPGPDLQAAAVEHARARARGALISEYEERLNRIEHLLTGGHE